MNAINVIFNRAVKNHQEGKTDIAQELYNQVLKIDPNQTIKIFPINCLMTL